MFLCKISYIIKLQKVIFLIFSASPPHFFTSDYFILY